jgi:hypothetical protein
MTHPLVDQFRFTRSEWLRGLQGISEQDAMRHFGPMNCISWTVGHLAWHEQRVWLERAQGQVTFPILNDLCATGAAMSTPSLHDMLDLWHQVTRAVDPFLDSFTTGTLQDDLQREGSAGGSIGSALRRNTYHYWFHIGEIQAIRQMLGHTSLPFYVGAIEREAPYRPE